MFLLPGNIVNRSSPLNRGLVAWWLHLPNRMCGGGSTLRDIYGTNHGTLTNGPTWSGSLGRPGGFGSLQFTAAPYVALTLPATGTTWTLSFWIRPGSPGGDYHSLFSPTSGNGIYLFNSGGFNKINFYYNGDHLSTTALTTNVWQHIVVSVNAGNLAYYLNGVPDGTYTGALSFTPSRIGNNNDSQSLTAYIDDYRYYIGRALTDAEAMSLYKASRSGYQQELNWQQRPIVGTAAAAAAGYRYVIGAGVGGLISSGC